MKSTLVLLGHGPGSIAKLLQHSREIQRIYRDFSGERPAAPAKFGSPNLAEARQAAWKSISLCRNDKRNRLIRPGSLTFMVANFTAAGLQKPAVLVQSEAMTTKQDLLYRSFSAAPGKLLRRGRFDLSLGASPSLAMLLRRGRGEDETEIP